MMTLSCKMASIVRNEDSVAVYCGCDDHLHKKNMFLETSFEVEVKTNRFSSIDEGDTFLIK